LASSPYLHVAYEPPLPILSRMYSEMAASALRDSSVRVAESRQSDGFARGSRETLFVIAARAAAP